MRSCEIYPEVKISFWSLKTCLAFHPRTSKGGKYSARSRYNWVLFNTVEKSPTLVLPRPQTQLFIIPTNTYIDEYYLQKSFQNSIC